VSTPSSYSTEIYLRGREGHRPTLPTDLNNLEAYAKSSLAPEPFWYVAGAAGAGHTHRANLEAFQRWRIIPRMLTDATDRDLRTTVLGTSIAAPVIAAPVGVQSIMHPLGELAIARASAELGIPMVASTVSSYPMEEIAEANGEGQRWFQLYWPNDDGVRTSFLSRAERAGFTALVLTLDTWLVGWRTHDLDHGYLPFLRGTGLANYFSDPAFRAGLQTSPEQDLDAAVQHWLPIFTGTDRSWEDVTRLREQWPHRLVLKGIQDPSDARRAVEAGVDAVVVSNHGGRQVDGAVASLDALPAVVQETDGAVEVYFDSGIRSGADIVKALALGARAVLVGRPWMYGLGLDGYDGVNHVLRCLLADLDLTLALSGNRTPGNLGRHSLVQL
jgi:isopentenyl diphosphate isomerase/L-lactate dehydrogenase-like FMN-dependent dehydrogenase